MTTEETQQKTDEIAKKIEEILKENGMRIHVTSNVSVLPLEDIVDVAATEEPK